MLFEGVEGGGPTQSPPIESIGSVTVPGLSPFLLDVADEGWFLVSDVAAVLAGLTTNLSYLTILAILLIVASYYALWRTAFGLRLRSCGEAPHAAATLGVRVKRYKYIAVVASGAFAGVGGVFLAEVLNNIYREGQTAGRGYIGLAAMIFGNWRPGGLAAGAGLFGFTDALQLRGSEAVHALLAVAALALLLWAIWIFARRKGVVGGVVALVFAASVRLVVPRHRRAPPAGDVRHAVRHHAGRPRPGLPAAATARRRTASPIEKGRTSAWRSTRAGTSCARQPSTIMQRAYAPYSSFKVGVAGRVDDGRIVVGCNVENASYGVGLCAECGMVSALHASGGGRLVAVACVDQHGARADALRSVPAAAVRERRAGLPRRHGERDQADERGAARRVRTGRPGRPGEDA